MKFSELWLREWVNPVIDSASLSNQITMVGLEVNSVRPIASAFHGVVVGEVIECNHHPNADKLRVTKIKVGGKHLLNIVCGAPNCRKGLKVAVAKIGAVLPGDFKIKAIKMRGEPSEGMLCSFSELGISDSHNDIIELPLDAPIGSDIREYLQLDDWTIEISVTSNRADCLGIIGVARDIAALNKIALNEPNIRPVAPILNETLPIRVDVPTACPRYLSRIVKDINMKAVTPLWMREKLRRCGIYSVHPVVDITNYVLLELGQPMHAFDLDRINGGIVVRMAEEDEKLTLLNGNEATLNNDTLVIADSSNVLAMAGIFGGAHSSVHEYTRHVLLECAFFSPLVIIGSTRRHGLHTDSSHRYERGVDPSLQHKALERATRLLLEICGGKAGPITDISAPAELPQRAIITLRRKKLDQLIGYAINDVEVGDILHRLGCEISAGKNHWRVVPPSWRFDIAIEEDLVGEVARIYGYDNIPNVPVQASLKMTRHHETDLSLKRAKDLLVDKGYQEAITYSFVDPKVQALLHPNDDSLVLQRPISVEMSVMRLSLWTGLLRAVVYNQNRQQSRVRMFETGLRFIPDRKENLGVCQDIILAGVISGDRHGEHWDLACNTVDFYDLKGDLESLLELTGRLDAFRFVAAQQPALHPGQSAEIILAGERVGLIGVVHPEIQRKLHLNDRTVVFEVLWDKVADRILPDAKTISRFPENRRDIAIVVADSIPAADIIAECKKVGVNQLVGVKLFDVYRGKGVDDGFKSLAISLIFQDTSRTLEEGEIAATIAKCVEALKERFQASLRD